MQFPHINKYESLIEKHLKPTFQPIIQPFTYQPKLIDKQNLEEIFSNIQQINLSRSYYSALIYQQDNTMESYQLKSSNSSENVQLCEFNEQNTRSQTRKRSNTNRSLIFMSGSFGKNKTKSSSSNYKQLKVYYFNMPIYKSITFDNKTTIAQLIKSALQAYSNDKSLEPSKIKNMAYNNYQLRLLKSQDTSDADMTIQPIGYQRLISENIFDSLVLIHSQINNKSLKKDAYNSILTEKSSLNQNPNLTIQLYNQQNQLLEKLEILKTQSLQKLYSHIQLKNKYNLKNYYLVEDHLKEELPKDYQISNLSSHKLYIVLKRFIDESQEEIMSKPKLMKYSSNNKNKEKQDEVISNLPIGLAEASRYQQFYVIKVNQYKARQQRIIGIDQHKIYNYDRSIKQSGRKTSLFSKIFGAHETTGTKRPFRLISQISHIKKIENGIVIIYHDKQNVLLMNDSQSRERMFRKLNYLLNYYREEQNRQNFKYRKTLF